MTKWKAILILFIVIIYIALFWGTPLIVMEKPINIKELLYIEGVLFIMICIAGLIAGGIVFITNKIAEGK